MLFRSPRKLLTEVWGAEYSDATSLLRTHIANLRRKLRHPSRARLLKNFLEGEGQ